MQRRDTADVFASVAAATADAAAVFGGFALAKWMRFDGGWDWPFAKEPPASLAFYLYGALLGTVVFLLIFRALGLYVRPQLGTFSERVPRLVRSVALGILLSMALAFAIRTDPPYSRWVIALSSATILLLVLVERAVLFHLEITAARRSGRPHRVLIVGVDDTAGRLRNALEAEPRLRARVAAFLRPEPDAGAAPSVPAEMILGDLSTLRDRLPDGGFDRVVLTQTSIPHEQIVELIVLCDRHLVPFQMVPDLFRVLTSRIEVSDVAGVPLIGLGRWPLDLFWNRALKRAEDIAGGIVGLLIFGLPIAAAAALVRLTSSGPAFYRQERCGEKGRRFTLFKIRSMRADAEEETGPVWAAENDPRRTRLGAFLRRWNIDELPQFWNVLRGDMSVVGPRPERPHFVEKFREDIARYMWRHVSKPGMTGWAQVNGLRGNTDIRERIAYDLYYLENWSLALDFKIILRTFFARKNAY
jgi:exopolysaccharide biosynthesis polyprenyl glycosylphosphotransferase